MSQLEFKLPIEYLSNKRELDSSLIQDLELTISENEEKEPLYNYVFDSNITVFGNNIIPKWSQYYTSDLNFLKETQTLIKRDAIKPFEKSHDEMYKIWNEMRAETGFYDKYQYIEISWFKQLNNNPIFLQTLSLYNMSSPIFSLALPILLLIMPFFLLRAQGRNISVTEYYQALKQVLSTHQLGQIFNISSATWDKRIYIVLSFEFYIFQLYQNGLACFFNSRTSNWSV